MNLLTAAFPHIVLHIAQHMRAVDREEIFATRPDADYIRVASDTMDISEAGGPVYIAWHGGEPCAVYGASPLWPGVWNVFAYATDSFGKVAWMVTKHIKRKLIPGLIVMGAHRAQCHSLVTHTEAHRWLKLLGAIEEARISGYGKNGEDFFLFGWTQESTHVLRSWGEGASQSGGRGATGRNRTPEPHQNGYGPDRHDVRRLHA